MLGLGWSMVAIMRPKYDQGDKMQHEGWTNHETWLVNLWMSNNQRANEYWTEVVELTMGAEEPHLIEAMNQAANQMSQYIKEEHKENTPSVRGVYADLLNSVMSKVNWYEIAMVWIETHLKNLEYKAKKEAAQ